LHRLNTILDGQDLYPVNKFETFINTDDSAGSDSYLRLRHRPDPIFREGLITGHCTCIAILI
jgi:hypothetical protein